MSYIHIFIWRKGMFISSLICHIYTHQAPKLSRLHMYTYTHTNTHAITHTAPNAAPVK